MEERNHPSFGTLSFNISCASVLYYIAFALYNVGTCFRRFLFSMAEYGEVRLERCITSDVFRIC